MKVVMFPAAEDGSAQYRIHQPAAALQAKGYDVEVLDPKAPLAGVRAAEADVIVFNRPTNPDVMKMIASARENHLTVVIDIDDNFDSIDRDHAVYWKSKGISQVMHEACAAADLVTVTTPKLAEIYGHGHGVVIPNYVDETWLEIEPREMMGHKWPHVGWTGTVASHPHDLAAMGNGLRRAIDDVDCNFVYIGSERPGVIIKAAGLKSAMSYGWQHGADYPAVYASFDVAIAPLADTAFNEAKSWLKGLEAAALGVPFVASPTVEYQRLHSLGAGWTAKDPADWRRKIGYLLKDEQARAELAFSGKEAARQLTIQGNCERYIEAWTDAHLAQRSGVR